MFGTNENEEKSDYIYGVQCISKYRLTWMHIKPPFRD